MNHISPTKAILAQLEDPKVSTVRNHFNVQFTKLSWPRNFLSVKIFINIKKDIFVLQNKVCKMLLSHHNTWSSLNVAHAISDCNNFIYLEKAPILKKILQGT